MSLIEEHRRAHVERQRRLRVIPEVEPRFIRKPVLKRPPPPPLPANVVDLQLERLIREARDIEALMAETSLVGLLQRDVTRPSIDTIQRHVAKYYELARDDFLTIRRAGVVRPRQVAMYLAKKLTLRSLPEIGRRFGGRDHTTIIHAVERITELRKHDERLRNDLQLIVMSMIESGVCSRALVEDSNVNGPTE